MTAESPNRTAPAAHASLRLHPQLPPGLAASLRPVLAGAFGPEADGGRQVVTAEALAALPPGEPAVVVVEQLRPELAPMLGRDPPALFLGATEALPPRPWELGWLAAVLAGRPLLANLGADARRWTIRQVEDLSALASDVEAMVKPLAGRGRTARGAADVAYELAANALLDAPVDASGAPKYAFARDRGELIAPVDACEFVATAESSLLTLAVHDAYGRLPASAVGRAVAKLERTVQVDTNGGGAGLGLVRILDKADMIAVRVQRRAATEVVAVLDLSETRPRDRRCRSLLYVSAGG